MQIPRSILIFNDSGGILPELLTELEAAGYEVYSSRPELLSQTAQRADKIGIIIYSTNSGTAHTLDKIKRVMGCYPSTPVLVVSAKSPESFVIETFKAGIRDYFTFPPEIPELLTSVARHITTGGGDSAHSGPTEKKKNPDTTDLISTSQIMVEVKQRLRQAAKTDATVLITGETGTGKDLAATWIHSCSNRRHRPYINVNCAALPEGLIESELFGYAKGAFTGADMSRKGKFALARGGTLFLDEIGEIPLHLQAKLLQAIDTKSFFPIGGDQPVPVDVKILAATNKDLGSEVQRGNFRIDLYYRINIVEVTLPPLRRRGNDLQELTDHFVEKMNRQYGLTVKGFTDHDMGLMSRYRWPGNVRELQNTIEMAFIQLLGKDHLQQLSLPGRFIDQMPRQGLAAENDRQRLLTTLVANNWNKTRTAEKLNWSRMTVHRKIKKYNIVQKKSAQ